MPKHQDINVYKWCYPDWILSRMIRSISNSLSTLFTILYGLSFSLMSTQMIKDLMGKGVGEIYSEGLLPFFYRSLVIGITYILSGIFFFHVIQFIYAFTETKSVFVNYCRVFLIIILSAGPWTCYHFTRFLSRPVTKGIIDNYRVDAIYLSLYIPSLLIMLLVYKIVLKIF